MRRVYDMDCNPLDAASIATKGCMKYDIETLIEIFTEHAKKAQQQQSMEILRWKENNPHEPLPTYFENDFSLPLALKAICEKIMELEKEIG